MVDVRPNPTTGNIYFNLLGLSNNLSVVVRSLQGQAIIAKQHSNANGNYSIDLTSLSSGMYVLIANDVKTKEKATVKVVKQ